MRTLGAVKAYYHARARRIRRLVARRGPVRAATDPAGRRARRSWSAAIAALPPGRTLDVACGTGFLTRHLRGEIVGLDQSDAMLAVAPEQAAGRRPFVQGDALVAAVRRRRLRARLHEPLLRPPRGATTRAFLDEARRVAPRARRGRRRLRDGADARRAGRSACSTTAPAGRSTSAASRPGRSPRSSAAARCCFDGPLVRRRPRVTRRRSTYRSLASLQRDQRVCRACVEAGYPLESLPVLAPARRAARVPVRPGAGHPRGRGAATVARPRRADAAPLARARRGRVLRDVLLRVGHALLPRARRLGPRRPHADAREQRALRVLARPRARACSARG